MEWRYLEAPAEPGALAMATDEALLDLLEQDGGTPILRLYSWATPTLSLGYRQPLTSERWETLRHGAHLDLVRRPTGGAAVLHAHEETYAVLLPTTLIGNPPSAYRAINRALAVGLAILGVPTPDSFRPVPPSRHSPFLCFASHSPSDLAVGGRKLVGSAQRRRRRALLQHGSIPIAPPSLPPGHPLRDSTGSATLADLLGSPPPSPLVRDAVRRGFEMAFEASLRPDAFSPAEEALRIRLAREKHASPAWLFR